jgi:histidinol dehydrogenase
MTVTPARIAGCKTILVATPPRSDGTLDPVVLYAAKAGGATHVLRAGGAQAIAALAHGTAKIPRVQAIVGPGNAYVTAAKQLVAGLVHTDAPAGPSELLVVADRTAKPSEVALDLLAQAEHDPDAQVLLVATDRKLADAVRRELEERLPDARRREVIEASLRDHAALLVAKDLSEALEFANDYAPEHLTLMVRNPAAALAKVRNAGSVFLGRHAPVSLGDYGSGTNHVLPTMGHARVRGGLSVEDFRKWVTWQEVTPAGLRRIGPAVATVARAEGLIAHAEAVEERLGLE